MKEIRSLQPTLEIVKELKNLEVSISREQKMENEINKTVTLPLQKHGVYWEILTYTNTQDPRQ